MPNGSANRREYGLCAGDPRAPPPAIVDTTAVHRGSRGRSGSYQIHHQTPAAAAVTSRMTTAAAMRTLGVRTHSITTPTREIHWQVMLVASACHPAVLLQSADQ